MLKFYVLLLRYSILLKYLLLFQILLKITDVRVKEKSALDENMSITPPVFWFCCECCKFTVQ